MLTRNKLLTRKKPLRSRGKKKPTKAEAAYMDAIARRGCVIAWVLGMDRIPGEVHHLTVGSKHGAPRRGHKDTVCLNSYSHRGVPFGGWTFDQCKAAFGPSLALEPKAFREKYPDSLLLELQQQLLDSPEDEAA